MQGYSGLLVPWFNSGWCCEGEQGVRVAGLAPVASNQSGGATHRRRLPGEIPALRGRSSGKAGLGSFLAARRSSCRNLQGRRCSGAAWPRRRTSSAWRSERRAALLGLGGGRCMAGWGSGACAGPNKGKGRGSWAGVPGAEISAVIPACGRNGSRPMVRRDPGLGQGSFWKGGVHGRLASGSCVVGWPTCTRGDRGSRRNGRSGAARRRRRKGGRRGADRWGQAVSSAGAAGECAGERELWLASGPGLSERVSTREAWAWDAGTGRWRGSRLGRWAAS
jgi:hypothetical protein